MSNINISNDLRTSNYNIRLHNLFRVLPSNNMFILYVQLLFSWLSSLLLITIFCKNNNLKTLYCNFKTMCFDILKYIFSDIKQQYKEHFWMQILFLFCLILFSYVIIALLLFNINFCLLCGLQSIRKGGIIGKTISTLIILLSLNFLRAWEHHIEGEINDEDVSFKMLCIFILNDIFNNDLKKHTMVVMLENIINVVFNNIDHITTFLLEPVKYIHSNYL